MFQEFTASSAPSVGATRTRALMHRLAEMGLDAFIVPRSDEHMGEYVPPSAERLKWLTGFTGSAGLAAVTRRRAALFVDGRYTLQASQQVDTRLFAIRQIPDERLGDWLVGELGSGARVAYDPWLHTTAWVNALTPILARKSIGLRPVGRNPVDELWGRERPAPPVGPITVQPLEWAGESAADKIARLQKDLKAEGRDGVILTLPDSIAWLLNIRGSDVKHNPTPLAFAVIHAASKPELFVDNQKLDADVRAYLAPLVRLRSPDEIAERIRTLKDSKRRIALDEATAAYWFRRALGGTSPLVVQADDPCLLPKARKNAAEIRGARVAHERDGVAMARYLAWLHREAPTGRIDEIAAVKRLEAMRAETQALKEISFDTISGSGPNGRSFITG